jgi:hypothetical protein
MRNRVLVVRRVISRDSVVYRFGFCSIIAVGEVHSAAAGGLINLVTHVGLLLNVVVSETEKIIK